MTAVHNTWQNQFKFSPIITAIVINIIVTLISSIVLSFTAQECSSIVSGNLVLKYMDNQQKNFTRGAER